MMMAKLLSEIERFCSDTGLSPSGFGRRFMRDPGFVFRLRAGSEVMPSTAEKLRSAMAKERRREPGEVAKPARRRRSERA
jgi:hypothetical protein